MSLDGFIHRCSPAALPLSLPGACSAVTPIPTLLLYSERPVTSAVVEALTLCTTFQVQAYPENVVQYSVITFNFSRALISNFPCRSLDRNKEPPVTKNSIGRPIRKKASLCLGILHTLQSFESFQCRESAMMNALGHVLSPMFTTCSRHREVLGLNYTITSITSVSKYAKINFR